jgi:DNA-binding XRE family transcriptional regulator
MKMNVTVPTEFAILSSHSFQRGTDVNRLALPLQLSRPRSTSAVASLQPPSILCPNICFSTPNMNYSSGALNCRVASTHNFDPQLPISPSKPIYYDISVRFGTRLRELRRNESMTQIDMAVAFGIDRSYISDVECGKKGISLATLEVMAIGFRMSLSELLRDL